MDIFRIYQRAPDDPFPNRTPENTRQTSNPENTYNCFGWALDRTKKIRMGWAVGFYWPEGVPRGNKPQYLIQAFECHGFVCCDNGSPEAGVEKIALYGTSEKIRHAARQVASGKWESKLGILGEDVEHSSLDAFAGETYGAVVQFMARKLPA